MLGDDDFRKVLDHFDLPWAGYRKVRKGVRKRLWRDMRDLGCPDIDAYLALVARRQEVFDRCRQCLLVTISRFFRDRHLWDALQSCWLPVLEKRFPEGLRAWSAGCAGGEEPYSLAMAWLASGCHAGALGTSLHITATDIKPECLERARLGIYGAGSLKEVPDELRRRFFTSRPRGRWAVDPQLEELIDWKLHDLLHDPPPAAEGAIHLLLLRNNLLTYYQGETLQAALEGVLSTLAPGGLLILGAHERLPEVSPPFVRDENCPWIYQRAEGC